MVGNRIRGLRTARGMTISELARHADVSTGLISQVERDLTDPSLATIRKIARALDVPLFSLFEEIEGEELTVVRRKERMQVQSATGGITYSRVSAGRGRLEVLEGTLAPGSASAPEPWSHPSEECVLVTEGTLIVEVAGRESSLEAGDSCYLDSRVPHRYRTGERAGATFIVSITPPSY
ncbi:helix-turn-helix domain-containing protein [Pseudonocardia spinosispora]|uniref:helix-turn-helix domain-containing protein n=1 Tax=Pseudonocardia spinosispora TaxID=103441 RepID=UPI0004920E10|nr:XRE family transcriptional regulator [Pseudonocardia spinosispora]